MRRRSFTLALLLSLGCAEAAPADAGMDAGARDDASVRADASADAAPGADAATSTDGSVSLDGGAGGDAGADAGRRDGGRAEEGFATISATCGLVAAELARPSPSYFVARLDFMDDAYEDPGERALLTPDAQEILREGTAGGSSAISEAFAMEVLARCEGASLLWSETEVVYDPPESDKTDMVVEIDGARVGVSVVRAFVFPLETPYRLEDARRVIGGKLASIFVSTMNVVAEQAWDKQILAVLAYADQAEMILDMYRRMSDGMTLGDTIIYVIVTDGDDAIIYD